MGVRSKMQNNKIITGARIIRLARKYLKEHRINLEARIRPMYEYYIKNVSGWTWAAPFDTLLFLIALTETLKNELDYAPSILNLGSGISSLALRTVDSVKVTCCDTDTTWLKKTEDVLKRFDLKTNRLYDWSALPVLASQTFDLIFDDLKGANKRHKHLQMLLDKHLKPDVNILIYDDAHRVNKKQISKILAACSFEKHDIKNITTCCHPHADKQNPRYALCYSDIKKIK